ncbi:MAG: serine hydrolase domain-containing protein [Aureispira sp.]
MKPLLLVLISLLLVKRNAAQQQTNLVLDQLVQAFIQEQGIPTSVVAPVRTDTTYYGKAGMNKKARGTATSFMAMKLVEEKKITLDVLFFDYFPNLKAISNSAYHTMTLGDLLRHQAGIRAYTSGLEFKELPEMGTKLSERKLNFVKAVLAQTPVNKGAYSNAGYVLASLLLEQIAGMSYEALLEATMQALQLDYVLGAPNQKRLTNPWGHWEENGVLLAHRPEHPYQLEDFMLPAGNLSMNIVDYVQFIQAHLQRLTGTSNYLKASSYQRLHYGLEDYSYGWRNERIGGHLASSHDGSLGTFYAHTILIPSLDIAVIILTNSAEEAHIEAIYQLRGKLMRLREQF